MNNGENQKIILRAPSPEFWVKDGQNDVILHVQGPKDPQKSIQDRKFLLKYTFLCCLSLRQLPEQTLSENKTI